MLYFTCAICKIHITLNLIITIIAITIYENYQSLRHMITVIITIMIYMIFIIAITMYDYDYLHSYDVRQL